MTDNGKPWAKISKGNYRHKSGYRVYHVVDEDHCPKECGWDIYDSNDKMVDVSPMPSLAAAKTYVEKQLQPKEKTMTWNEIESGKPNYPIHRLDKVGDFQVEPLFDDGNDEPYAWSIIYDGRGHGQCKTAGDAKAKLESVMAEERAAQKGKNERQIKEKTTAIEKEKSTFLAVAAKPEKETVAAVVVQEQPEPEKRKSFHSETPNSTWTVEQLTRFIHSCLKNTKHLETEENKLELTLVNLGRSKTIHVWRVGHAAYVLRDKLKGTKGAWAKWQKEQGKARTTIWRAIKLYEAEEDQNKVKNLTLTQAYERYGILKTRESSGRKPNGEKSRLRGGKSGEPEPANDEPDDESSTMSEIDEALLLTASEFQIKGTARNLRAFAMAVTGVEEDIINENMADKIAGATDVGEVP